MMPYKHEIGDAVNLAFEIAVNGAGVTGQTPVVAVQRISDSQWLNDAKTAWQAGYNDIVLTELDATNLPGVYGTDVTQFGGAEEKWRVYYKNTGTYAGIDVEAHEFVTAVWTEATRTLTAGTNIVLAKGTGITGFNDLSAAQVNTECDTALTDYDPPTRTEATADKDAIIVQVDANETKIDTLLTRATELRLAELDPANIPTDIANVKGDTAAILVDTNETQTKLPTNFIMGSTTQSAKDDEIDAILATLTVPTFTVETDTYNSALQFKTNLASTIDDFYKGIWIRAQTGALVGAAPHKVSTYNGTTRILTLTNSFVSIPAAGDIFEIISE